MNNWTERYETSYTNALLQESKAVVAGEPAASLRRATTAVALRLCVAAGREAGYTAKEVELLVGCSPSTIRDAAERIIGAGGDFRRALEL